MAARKRIRYRPQNRDPDHRHILLTGPPGCGKTTVVIRALERLHDVRLEGFYTVEVRDGGTRIGFDAVDLTGRRVRIAEAASWLEEWGRTIVSELPRVGKYCVYVDRFEAFLDDVGGKLINADAVVMDEIGKMECLSPRFVDFVHEVFESPLPVLATVPKGAGGIAAEVKRRRDAKTITVTPANRDTLPEAIAKELRAIVRAGL